MRAPGTTEHMDMVGIVRLQVARWCLGHVAAVAQTVDGRWTRECSVYVYVRVLWMPLCVRAHV